MPPRSMVNQGLYLQKETVPGTPLTAAMKRVLGIRGIPQYTVEGEDFKASGYKVNTSRVVNTEEAEISIETIQDYNAALWVLTGGYGAPVSAPVATVTGAFTHTFTLNPKVQDPLVSFTSMWGDSTQALQMPYAVFQSLELTIDRSGLSLSSSMRGRSPITGIALPTGAAVTEIPSIPMASRQWNVYADDTFATLGSTQLLAVYKADVTFGDKYTPDYVINRAQPSYTDMVESEDTEYSGVLQIGFDSAAIGLINSFKNGALKFFRVEAIGPVIGTTATTHSLVMDFCARIINPTEIMAAPNSPSVTLGFDLQFTVDPISTTVSKAVLTNGLASI